MPLAASLERKAVVFDKLRTAMRIALPEGKNGINDNGDDVDVKSIEEKVTAFRKWLGSNERRKVVYAKMIDNLINIGINCSRIHCRSSHLMEYCTFNRKERTTSWKGSSVG